MTMWLEVGGHESRDDGMCAMEWVAYLAGEPHSHHPRCVDPLLQAYVITLNDTLGGSDRQRLLPFLRRCIGTAEDGVTGMRALAAARAVTGQAITAKGTVARCARHIIAESGVDTALCLLDNLLPPAAPAEDVLGLLEVCGV